MRLSLNTYSLAIAAGYYQVTNIAPTYKDPKSFIPLVKQAGFDSLELPLDYYFKSLNSDAFNLFLRQLEAAGIKLMPCIENFHFGYLMENIPHLARAKMNLVRIKMPHTTTFYGGNRYKNKHFSIDLKRFSEDLDKLEPTLFTNNVSLAIENHQDLDVVDLVRICEASSNNKRFITWDVGNSLATMRTPVQFLDKAEKYIANIHFKDYVMRRSNSGIALVRSNLGEGILSGTCLPKRIQQLPNLVNVSMELAAHPDRIADIYDPEYPKFFEHTIEEKQVFLEFVEKYSTALDKHEDCMSLSLNVEQREIRETLDSCLTLKALFGDET